MIDRFAAIDLRELIAIDNQRAKFAFDAFGFLFGERGFAATRWRASANSYSLLAA
jgi:hypothetical protein